MQFSEPKVEFVSIDMEDVVRTSTCTNSEYQSTWEGCGCSDGVNETLVPCDNLV